MGAGELFLRATAAEFRRHKDLAEAALAQVSPEAWFYAPAEGSNALAHIVKHLAGNLRSRWTDFLHSDGEKPDRRRDEEFELGPADSVDSLRARWEEGWGAVFAALEGLGEGDLGRTVRIRSQPHSVVEAAQRSLAHAAYHCGQIVQLAKQIRGPDFQSLSIPRGQSERFWQTMREKHN